jgi:hypothetical protein
MPSVIPKRWWWLKKKKDADSFESVEGENNEMVVG